MKNFFQSLLSPTGEISSKRFMGMLALTTSLCCIVYLTIIEGGTNTVENLLETTLIVSSSLLGISSVTNIWKNNKKTQKKGPA